MPKMNQSFRNSKVWVISIGTATVTAFFFALTSESPSDHRQNEPPSLSHLLEASDQGGLGARRSPANDKNDQNENSTSFAAIKFLRNPKEETSFRFHRKIFAKMGEKPILDFSYTGVLRIRAENDHEKESEKNDQFFATFDFSPETIEAMPGELREVAISENASLLFRMSPEGKLFGIQSKKNASLSQDAKVLVDQKARILIDLISHLAFQNLEDLNGPYESSIQWGKRGELWFATKTKSKYLGQKNSSNPKIINSTSSIAWESGEAISFRGIVGLEATEELETGMNQWRVTQNSQLKISQIETHFVAESKLAKGTFEKTSLQQLIAEAPQNQLLARPFLSWPELSAQLTDLGHLSGSERLRVFSELIRSLEKNPNMISSLRDLIRKNRSDMLLMKLSLGALAACRSEGSQTALREIFNSSAPLPVRQLILTALTTTSVPLTSDTKQFLVEVIHDSKGGLQEGAAYALGAALKKEVEVSKDAPNTPSDDSSVRTLRELLRQSKSVHERGIYIDAIGNSGSPALLPDLKEYLSSTEVDIREKAVFSLRWMPANTVEPFLLSALDDAEIKIRRSALLALKYQKNKGNDLAPYWGKVKTCSQNEISPDLRRTCAALLNDPQNPS
jgi:hypothetical protein